MISRLKEILDRLRDSLSAKAENAYKERDEAQQDSRAESYSAGEAHAYGVSADEVREAEKEPEDSERV